jgi:hypothetical protein
MTTPAAPSHIWTALVGHLATLVDCTQNAVYVTMLVYFINTFVSWVCFVAIAVSPVESWKGLFYNMWFSALMCSMMLSFKDTLEAMILFENAKRHRDGKKDATTIISMDENSVQMKHVDNGVPSSAWTTVVSYMLHQLLNKAEKNEDKKTSTPEATTPVSSTEDEIKNEATTTDDEIKQDAASASSSARSSADTADALH